MTDAQFMVSGDTGDTEGTQRITLKKQIQTTEIILRGILNLPRLKGPLGISFLTQISLHKNGIPYDTLIAITAVLIMASQ